MADALTTPTAFFDGEGVEASPTSLKSRRRKERKAEKELRQARRNPKPVTARTENQQLYIDSLHENSLTFGIGPAGSGKTYVPARVFGQQLVEGKIEKLYLARPNVSKKKHENGFLPGTLEEKTAPWLVPIFEGLKASMGPSEFDRLRKEKRIEEIPYEFIQGRTLGSDKGAACLVDEAENLDIDDLYITLTRQGENLTMCLAGDVYQARIANSGLAEAISMVERHGIPDTGIIEFTDEDIVRSGQAKHWARAFRAHWGHSNLRNVTNCGNEVGDTVLGPNALTS
ncbi:phosphate starvation-inducible protein [Phaeobacter phage MD18]|nr:phosphate starvation-inducible protein [Phaeobacter phage MD18]